MGVERRRLVGRSRGKGGSHKFQASVEAVVPLLSFFGLAACAIHPVQQDVTGIPTPVIVNFIRCETRLAIQDKAIKMLQLYRGGTDQRALALADYLITIRGEPWNINPNTDLSDADERKFYNRYIQTGVAFDFTLDITEDNKATVNADPVRLITNGTAGIGLNASGDFNRENSRHFVMSDTFSKILSAPSLHCNDRNPNFAYPIAGSIGISELIATFVDLNEDDNLQALTSGNSRVFADTLTFTTTLIGSVTPTVQINPVGKQWGLGSPTNFIASGERLDKHTLIIGLSMQSPTATVHQVASAVPGVPVVGTAKSALQKNTGVSAPEQSALDAVTQTRIDNYLDHARR